MNQPSYTPLDHWEAWANKPQPAQQEPVAWEGVTSIKYPNGTPRLIFTDKQTAEEWLGDFVDGVAWLAPLYTTPAQRKPLTLHEIVKLTQGLDLNGISWVGVIRAVEAAHGIKD